VSPRASMTATTTNGRNLLSITLQVVQRVRRPVPSGGRLLRDDALDRQSTVCCHCACHEPDPYGWPRLVLAIVGLIPHDHRYYVAAYAVSGELESP
jgi:hypothetical protein